MPVVRCTVCVCDDNVLLPESSKVRRTLRRTKLDCPRLERAGCTEPDRSRGLACLHVKKVVGRKMRSGGGGTAWRKVQGMVYALTVVTPLRYVDVSIEL